MNITTKRQLLQSMLTVLLLCGVKIQDPQESYLDVLKAAPIVYKGVEKGFDLVRSLKKGKKKS